MKILTDQRTRQLFRRLLAIYCVFILISAVLIVFPFERAALCIFAASLCMVFAMLAVLYRYLRRQNEVIEAASERITEYIADNPQARIACDEEGELYKLFHKINSLAAILNARAENELKARDFLKETISDISHQLKTPIAALNIYNGILQEEAADQPTIREFTDFSEQELDRIESLVQNLLKIAKLDAGMIVMDKKPENVSGMMKSVERRFAFRAEQEEKKLLLTGPQETVLYCDRGWLVEAAGNLVKNALDHTGPGDTVSVQWREFSSMVQIIVKDNGSGIHPEDLYHIFKRFYRSRYSKDTQGIGLGLPLAKAVIELHNGTVEVDSKLDEGTVFTADFLVRDEREEGCL